MQNNHCKGDWFNLVCESYNKSGCLYDNYLLPSFPDDETQINTTGQAGRDTLCEAFIFFEDCINRFKYSRNFERDDKVVLDFGVGWGRILRFFIKEFYPQNLIGIDINQQFIDICESTFGYGRFLRSDAMPPIRIGDNSVDFVVGYSVYSHLSEDVCLSWIKEFERILRPGGMVALTTRGRWFFDYCEGLKSNEGYSSALSKMFQSFDEAREKYDLGKFVHSNENGVTGGAPLDGSFYGETFIPEVYAKRVYSEYFEVMDYEFTLGRTMHPIMFLKKPD